MLRFEELVFGPIHSRRLGSSLGINLLPRDGKFCNYDCIYCECGWNKDGISPSHILPTALQIKSALSAKLEGCLKDGIGIDSITFSGNGEPTIHPEFSDIVDIVIELRDKYYPRAKVSVLSNATASGNSSVFNALKKIDNPILKLDSCDDRGIILVNKPQSAVSAKSIINNMRHFKGDFILQAMLLKSKDFDSLDPDHISRWKAVIRELQPKEIQLYSLDRETPDKFLTKISIEEMKEATKDLLEEGFNIGYF